jgi:hypothetical protein
MQGWLGLAVRGPRKDPYLLPAYHDPALQRQKSRNDLSHVILEALAIEVLILT